MSEPNKVVVITGAASGIGAATAELFAKENYQLVLLDISYKGNTLDNSSARSEVKLDVSKAEEVEKVLLDISKTYGRIDVIVNNAGVGTSQFAKTEDHSVDDWHRVISINQSGVFYCMKYVLKLMSKQGFGNIVNVASLAGVKASGYNLAYSASKFAVVGMTKSAAIEYGRRNIRINCVCPGYTESPLLDSLFSIKPKLRDRFLQSIPMDRYGQPDEIAEAILWLSSDKSKFITGQSIILDGGLSL